VDDIKVEDIVENRALNTITITPTTTITTTTPANTLYPILKEVSKEVQSDKKEEKTSSSSSPITSSNDNNEVKNENSSRPFTRFELLLKRLEDMGFNDRKRNIEVLVKYGGDLTTAIQELLGNSNNQY